MEGIDRFRFWVDIDENQQARIEEVLGRKPEYWEGIFYEHTGDPPTMDEPIHIRYHIEAFGDHQDTWENWIVAFGELELPSEIEELTVPPWEGVTELVNSYLDTSGSI